MTHDTTSQPKVNEEVKMPAARKNGRGPAQVTASRPPFAPIPRALLRNPRVSAEAIKLWGIMDALAFEQVPPEIPILQARMVSERPGKDGQSERRVPGQASIYRWLKELEAGGGLRWDRNATLGDRFTLLDGAPESAAELVLRQLRTLMRQLQHAGTTEEHHAALAAMAQILTSDKASLTSENGFITGENLSLTSDNSFITGENPTPARENPNHVYRDMGETHETPSDTMPTHPPADGDDVPTPTELFLQEENLGVAHELRDLPLDLARQYVAEARQRGATLPAIAKGLRARWKREQARRQRALADSATHPPDWIDAASWPTLPADLQLALEGSAIDDEGYLCYYGDHEATITAHAEQLTALLAQARREQTVGTAR
jgi:hypothetical protein